jgi:hypothetical protein
LEVIAETVQWNDVMMLRISFLKKKYDFNCIQIPQDLYDRWDSAIQEYWKVQHEIKKYLSGDLMYRNGKVIEALKYTSRGR